MHAHLLVTYGLKCQTSVRNRLGSETLVIAMQLLENVAIANALQLEAARRRASRSARVLSSFGLRMRTNCNLDPGKN